MRRQILTPRPISKRKKSAKRSYMQQRFLCPHFLDQTSEQNLNTVNSVEHHKYYYYIWTVQKVHKYVQSLFRVSFDFIAVMGMNLGLMCQAHLSSALKKDGPETFFIFAMRRMGTAYDTTLTSYVIFWRQAPLCNSSSFRSLILLHLLFILELVY